jgi:hypothetical protein
MSLPSATHPCWIRASSGGLNNVKTNNLGIQLMTKRLQRSADPIEKKAAEVRDFFMKWERILSVEIEQLLKL